MKAEHAAPTTGDKEPASLIAYRSYQDTKAAAELYDIRKRVQQDIEQHNMNEANRAMMVAMQDNQQLREQLAAERENLSDAGRLLAKKQCEIQQLREQLAAAQAAIELIAKQAQNAWEHGSDDRALRESTLYKIAQYQAADTTALDTAIAAAVIRQMDKDDEMWSAKLANARHPLIDALKKCKSQLDMEPQRLPLVERLQGYIKCALDDFMRSSGNREARQNVLG